MDEKNVSAKLATKYGQFRIIVWQGERGREPVALITPTLSVTEPVLVRMHSECLTGDTFGSLQCDCNEQKVKSLEMIAASGNGIFLYLRQEGRGIGLFEKIKAYKLQEEGYDTYEANIKLGHKADEREYSIAKKILQDLNVEKIKLITGNPEKIMQMKEFGFNVVEQVPLVIEANQHNKRYLQTKQVKSENFVKNKK
jgi:3,4-dihydroxy 2-butanone 4-phosphate synthase/GTP cyclohydrolase II